MSGGELGGCTNMIDRETKRDRFTLGASVSREAVESESGVRTLEEVSRLGEGSERSDHVEETGERGLLVRAVGCLAWCRVNCLVVADHTARREKMPGRAPPHFDTTIGRWQMRARTCR